MKTNGNAETAGIEKPRQHNFLRLWGGLVQRTFPFMEEEVGELGLETGCARQAEALERRQDPRRRHRRRHPRRNSLHLRLAARLAGNDSIDEEGV